MFSVMLISIPASLQEFVKDAGSYSKKIVDDLLDQITSGDHSKTIYQLKQVCPGALKCHKFIRIRMNLLAF